MWGSTAQQARLIALRYGAGMKQRAERGQRVPPFVSRQRCRQYPGRDSNSYSTLVLGDFESPASTDSATRARIGNVAAGEAHLNVRLARPHSRRRIGSLPTKRFNPPAHLFLQRGVLGALDRCHEGREFLLLLSLELEPVALKLQETVEGLGDAILIRLRIGEDLVTQREPLRSFLHHQCAPAAIEALARLLQARHLLVAQADTLLGNPPQPLSELLLELLPAHRRALCLETSRSRPDSLALRRQGRSEHRHDEQE